MDYKFTQNFFYLRDWLLGLNLGLYLLRFLFLTLINLVYFSIKFYFDKIRGLSLSKGLSEGLSVRFSLQEVFSHKSVQLLFVTGLVLISKVKLRLSFADPLDLL